ncbi:MAG: LCP family protein [Anaerolineae bacterium]|jgi:LCP family protein required for cell wall assembly
MRHPDDRQLLSYLENALSPGDRAQVEEHLQTCDVCQARVEKLAATAENLTATLAAVGDQIPLVPKRSWQKISQRQNAHRSAIPFPLSLRRVATLTTLVTLIGALVVSLAGLAHTLAVAIQAPDRIAPTATAPSPASPSSMPGPLPGHPDGPKTPTALLILGIDGENASSGETDMLMLLYIDAEAKRAFLLSIPRDLYVEVPDHGQARAGSIYGIGERDETTDGLTLARQAISATLSIPVRHAALVRFESFVTLVDAIGGVDIDVPHAIDDPDFPDGHYGYDPLSIPAGLQHFDGALALSYARTRVEPAPGFDRTFRQRQLILAAQERVLRLEMLPDLIAQSPTLWTSVAGSLETDLSLSGVIDLALAASSISTEEVATADLGTCCTSGSVTSQGERVSLPQPEEIETLISSLLEEKDK